MQEKSVLKCIALVALNSLAAIYDGAYVAPAIALDLVVLGYGLSNSVTLAKSELVSK